MILGFAEGFVVGFGLAQINEKVEDGILSSLVGLPLAAYSFCALVALAVVGVLLAWLVNTAAGEPAARGAP